MRLSSYIKRDGSHSYGVSQGTLFRDADDAFLTKYPTLCSVLEADALNELSSAAENFEEIDQRDVTLLSPIPTPNKIICIGLNYRTHIAETGREQPSYPSIFTRYPGSLVGHGVSLERPHASEKFDFEGELAIVIGKRGRHIAPGDALSHVAGYTCLNDGSIRDYQRHTSQFWAGKNFDRTGSAGPWLVTTDEVGDVAQLTLETRLNGTTVQSTSVGDLLFGVADLLQYLSTVAELHPGDIIATGTPSGVGLFRDPPLWMKPGDKVEVEILKIGTLANGVVAEA